MTKIEISDENKAITLKDAYSDVTLKFFPDKKEFEQVRIIQEHYSTQKYEYKISTDPVGVSVRLIEAYDEPPLEYVVKDGVVLESEILSREYPGSLVDTKSMVENLRHNIDWHEVWIGSPAIFYILSKHPEIVSEKEYRRFLRKTDERIKNGLIKIEKFLKENDVTGLQIREDTFGGSVVFRSVGYPDNKKFSDEELEKTFKYSGDKKIKPMPPTVIAPPTKNNFLFPQATDEEKENYLIWQKQSGKINEYKNKTIEPLFNSKSAEYCGISEEELKGSSEILNSTDFFLKRAGE